MGNNLEFKLVAILFYILFGISLFLGVLFFINYNENPMIVYTYILTAIAMGTTILFSIFGMFRTKKSMLNSIIVLGILGALVLVSYLMASDEMPKFFGVEAFKLTATTLKLIDTSLFLMYILTAISFVGLLYTEIIRAFK